MYLYNKYTTWYNNIIAKAVERVDLTGYSEKHHIIPRSMGGSNTSANIVKLTAKEHFICHILLPKMTTGSDKSKMVRAAWMMASMSNKHQKRIKVKSRKYCVLKEEWIKYGNLNNPKTEQHKQNMRKPKPDGFGKRVSEYRTGKSWGYHHTDETKEKMSDWQKGIPKPTITCKHCNKEISIMNHAKWHGDKCKANPDSILYAAPQMNSTMKTCEHCNKEFNTGNYSRWHGDKCKFKQSA